MKRFSPFFKYFIIIVLAAIFSGAGLTAQERHFTLNNTQMIQLKSDLTGREHELIIILPASYKESPDKSYPVLYFMDAYWDTPLLNSIHGQLVYDRVIPELIMVGFSYPGENVNYGDLRRRDMAPADTSRIGGAGKFLQFIEETVIPYVESHYRTDKKVRAISGNSLGGFFTLYAMYAKPGLFNCFIAISPAVAIADQYLFKMDDAYASENNSLAARLFLSHGSAEYKPFRDPIIEFEAKIAKRNYKDFALLNYEIEGERHSGVKSEGYSRGLRWIFRDIVPEGPGGLEREFRGIED
ncbi:MAG: alpha/beta hydrolase [Calditrichaceae bacterium]|nr:alpha/beta hydrolase [Calditrichaceae bacterium]MBN2709788.1 alpha/beta hydrolase [Calditrichaceae bacterium]RQV94982.1 MAG: alpha/beta hydrolase [Calditrichota bacterium]